MENVNRLLPALGDYQANLMNYSWEVKDLKKVVDALRSGRMDVLMNGPIQNSDKEARIRPVLEKLVRASLDTDSICLVSFEEDVIERVPVEAYGVGLIKKGFEHKGDHYLQLGERACGCLVDALVGQSSIDTGVMEFTGKSHRELVKGRYDL